MEIPKIFKNLIKISRAIWNWECYKFIKNFFKTILQDIIHSYNNEVSCLYYIVIYESFVFVIFDKEPCLSDELFFLVTEDWIPRGPAWNSPLSPFMTLIQLFWISLYSDFPTRIYSFLYFGSVEEVIFIFSKFSVEVRFRMVPTGCCAGKPRCSGRLQSGSQHTPPEGCPELLPVASNRL